MIKFDKAKAAVAVGQAFRGLCDSDEQHHARGHQVAVGQAFRGLCDWNIW